MERTTLGAAGAALVGRALAGALVLSCANAAFATTVTLTVDARSNLFAAGLASPNVFDPNWGPGTSGLLPPSISLPAGTGRTIQLPSVLLQPLYSGGGEPSHGADGLPVPVVPPGYSATNLPLTVGPVGTPLSRLVHDNSQLFLAGVFLDASGQMGGTPSALRFSTGPSWGAPGSFVMDDFLVLAPVLRQTFFVGDGLTGTGAGAVQTFLVPDGATQLYLGFGDGGYFQGPIGLYHDNVGSVQVQAQVDAVPEPGTLELLLLGGAFLAAKKARRLLRR